MFSLQLPGVSSAHSKPAPSTLTHVIENEEDDWRPIRVGESPHHLTWKNRVADAKGLTAEEWLASCFLSPTLCGAFPYFVYVFFSRPCFASGALFLCM